MIFKILRPSVLKFPKIPAKIYVTQLMLLYCILGFHTTDALAVAKHALLQTVDANQTVFLQGFGVRFRRFPLYLCFDHYVLLYAGALLSLEICRRRHRP